jgi:hypothetical protein
MMIVEIAAVTLGFATVCAPLVEAGTTGEKPQGVVT